MPCTIECTKSGLLAQSKLTALRPYSRDFRRKLSQAIRTGVFLVVHSKRFNEAGTAANGGSISVFECIAVSVTFLSSRSAIGYLPWAIGNGSQCTGPRLFASNLIHAVKDLQLRFNNNIEVINVSLEYARPHLLGFGRALLNIVVVVGGARMKIDHRARNHPAGPSSPCHLVHTLSFFFSFFFSLSIALSLINMNKKRSIICICLCLKPRMLVRFEFGG